MDAYGQIGPNIEGYREDVEHVVQDLAVGLPVFVKLTDRSTQYRLLMTRCDGISFYVGASDPNLGTLDRPGPEWLFVAAVEKGAYVFRLGSVLAADFVADKLGLMGPVDGGIVGEFLSRVGSLDHQLPLHGGVK